MCKKLTKSGTFQYISWTTTDIIGSLHWEKGPAHNNHKGLFKKYLKHNLNLNHSLGQANHNFFNQIHLILFWRNFSSIAPTLLPLILHLIAVFALEQLNNSLWRTLSVLFCYCRFANHTWKEEFISNEHDAGKLLSSKYNIPFNLCTSVSPSTTSESWSSWKTSLFSPWPLMKTSINDHQKMFKTPTWMIVVTSCASTSIIKATPPSNGPWEKISQKFYKLFYSGLKSHSSIGVFN